ncbi:MAG: hypothetical protein M5U19_09565 [Microthrixaceae bacterium]|nr:hypothetical protein [Microthrixaceae bacterium]
MFYDGGNELERQRFRNDEGRGADESPTSYAEDEVDLLLSEGPFPWYAGELLDGGGSNRGSRLPGGQVARHAMNRYLRDLELARRSAASVGVEPVFVWQPLLVSAGPQAGNPGALTDEQWRFWEEMLDEARPMIPDDVVDLADVLDGFEEPVFKDLFHHNVEGSAVIAAALLDELRPTLRMLADG